MERRSYTLDCNWKVFVDNYLDGGYHVPHLHKGLDSVLDYSEYTITNGERYCLQSSPMVSDGADERTEAVRQGDRAFYYWIYPNFMINCYGAAMDTNLVIPRGVDQDRGDLRLLLRGRVGSRARRQPREHRGQRADSGRGRRRSASRCSAACGRARTTPAVCRCAAKPASISFIVSSRTISERGLTACAVRHRPAAPGSRRGLRPRRHHRQHDRRRHPARARRGRRPSARRLAVHGGLGRRRSVCACSARCSSPSSAR